MDGILNTGNRTITRRFKYDLPRECSWLRSLGLLLRSSIAPARFGTYQAFSQSLDPASRPDQRSVSLKHFMNDINGAVVVCRLWPRVIGGHPRRLPAGIWMFRKVLTALVSALSSECRRLIKCDGATAGCARDKCFSFRIGKFDGQVFSLRSP